MTKTIVDNREKHTQTDEDSQEDEQSKDQRTENSRCSDQFSGVELHQTDFEEHVSSAEECGTRGDLRDEEKIEQGNEREENNRKHQGKGEQFSSGKAKCVNEQGDASIGTKETNEANDGKERTEAKEESERIIDIDSQLKIDINITIGLLEERSQSIGLAVSPEINSDRYTRAENDSHLNQGPELTEISTLQSMK